VPGDTDVANALGAVVGQVRIAVEARVTQPREGLFRLSSDAGITDFDEEDPAIEAAEALVRSLADERVAEAGATDAEISVSKTFRVSTVEGQRMFIEAEIVAVASGRPRIAA
jgi:hypothetical protein